MGMRVGTSIRSFYPPTPRGGARRIAGAMVDRARAARNADLDSLFVGDHHATRAPYIQNVPILGRMLAEWNENPVGALFLLPLWNPVLLAEQIGTLACIAPGRFIVQCCVGADPDQFRAMGADPRRRGRCFERNFETLKSLLAGQEVESEELGAMISVDPIPAEAVEYWIGAEVPTAIDRAARIGDAWMPGPNVSVEEATRQLDFYLERCEAYGRPPRATPIRRNLHVAKSPDELERVIRPAVEASGPGMDSDKLIIGTVDEVAEAFHRLAEAGFSEVVARHFMEDHDAVLGSLERLGEVRKKVVHL